MASQDAYVIGVDYGTDSVRSIIVNAINGQEVASSVFYYPRWKDALYCDASINQFRQHPQDYVGGVHRYDPTFDDCRIPGRVLPHEQLATELCLSH